MEARVSCQPLPDDGVFVRPVVVEDETKVDARVRMVDHLQELEELLVPVT